MNEDMTFAGAADFLLRHPEFSLWISGALKSTAIVLIALALAFWFRKRSAISRTWILRLAIPALILAALSPFVSNWVPLLPVRLETPALLEPATSLAAESQFRESRSRETPRESSAIVADFSSASAEEEFPIENGILADLRGSVAQAVSPAPSDRGVAVKNGEKWIIPVWESGALIVVAYLVFRNLAGLFWLRKNGVASDKRIAGLANELAELRGMKRVECRTVSGLASPLLTGWTRAQLWLPAGAAEFSEEHLRCIFRHELAHHRHRDLWWRMAASGACALWWWNPWVWHLRNRLAHEAELAADESVVSEVESAADYAETLVRVAQGWPEEKHRRSPSAGVPMTGASPIERRVRAILSENPFRNRMGWIACVMAGSLACVGLCVAALQAVANPPEKAPSSIAEEKDPQIALASRLLADLERRHARMRFIHFTVSSVWTVTADGKKFSNETMPSKSEAWMDTKERRYRIEHTPRVVRWVDGAAPFGIRNETEIDNGKIHYDFENRRLSEMQESQTRWPSINMGETYEKEAVRFLEQIISGPLSQNPRYTIEEKMVDGHRIAEIVEEFLEMDGSTVIQRKCIHLDMEESAMVRLSQLISPQQSETPRNEWRLLEAVQEEAGDFRPVRWRQSSTFSDESYESIGTVTSFQIISGLPDGILDPPDLERERRKYVAPQGKAIQRDAIVFRFRDSSSAAVNGAKFRYRINSMEEVDAMADENGSFRIPLPVEEVTSLRVSCESLGYAEHVVGFSKYGDPLQLPETYDVTLQPASPISGRVIAEDGSPIEGATVRVMFSGGQSIWSVFRDAVSVDEKAITDAQGMWELDGFPQDLDGLYLRVSHKDYLPTTDVDMKGYRQTTGQDLTSLRDGTSRVILSAGNRFEGRILDWKNQPVKGARITEGDDNFSNKSPVAVADADGRFSLKLRDKKLLLITVEAADCRPWQGQVEVDRKGWVLRLEEPKVLRARVVREDGSPCANLNVSVDGWKDSRTLKFWTRTDADGRFVWSGAPEEPVTFTLGWRQNRPGEFLNGYPIAAKDEEQTIVNQPALRLRASVVDDATGKPLASFDFTPGTRFLKDRDRSVYWKKHSKRTGVNAVVEWQSSYMEADRESCFLIEAEGYEPLEKSYRTEQQIVEEVWRMKKR